MAKSEIESSNNINLCDEELFYFKRKYIPEEVIDEWLEGMFEYLPLYCEQGKVINSRFLRSIVQNQLLKGYPRITHSFRVTRKYDLNQPADLQAAISEVKQRLRNFR